MTKEEAKDILDKYLTENILIYVYRNKKMPNPNKRMFILPRFDDKKKYSINDLIKRAFIEESDSEKLLNSFNKNFDERKEITQTKTNEFKIIRKYNYGYRRLTIFHKKEKYKKSFSEELNQKIILSNGDELWIPIEIEIEY